MSRRLEDCTSHDWVKITTIHPDDADFVFELRITDRVERLTHEARFAAQRHEDTLSNFRDRNAELVRELETANLAIQGFEDANVSSGFTINFT